MDADLTNGDWNENRRYVHAELRRISTTIKELHELIDSNFKEHSELHRRLESVRVELETAMREKLEKKIIDVSMELVNVKVLAASRGGLYGAFAGIISAFITGLLISLFTRG